MRPTLRARASHRAKLHSRALKAPHRDMGMVSPDCRVPDCGGGGVSEAEFAEVRKAYNEMARQVHTEWVDHLEALEDLFKTALGTVRMCYEHGVGGSPLKIPSRTIPARHFLKGGDGD